MPLNYPNRIVCLTSEIVETLYLFGEQDRIVGIPAYAKHPPQACKEKKVIGAYTHVNISEILDLTPDLVIGFSDLQSDIAADLIKKGCAVFIFNQRSVQGILDMILTLSSIVHAPDKGRNLVSQLKADIDVISLKANGFSHHPKVYFEEWDQPMITGIEWVSEIIHLAGGKDCLGHIAGNTQAKDRIIKDPNEIVAINPDIIIASWCGKKFQPDRIKNRNGWDAIQAVQMSNIYELEASDILQPGPGALTRGIHKLFGIFEGWSLNVKAVLS